MSDSNFVCRKCHETKSRDNFGHNKAYSDERDTTCKRCRAITARERYHGNPAYREKQLAYHVKRRADPIKRAEDAKQQQKQRKQPEARKKANAARAARLSNDPFHRERLRERQRTSTLRRRAANPIGKSFSDAKYRAKCSGMSFSLTLEGLGSTPEFCPAMEIPMVAGAGRVHHGSPTIDRFDNSRGYEPDNVNIISHRANTIKSDATADELERIADWMEQKMGMAK